MEDNRRINQSDYSKSEFLRHEATNSEGDLVPELWDAIVDREVAIDRIVNAGSFDKPEVFKESGYLQKAKRVRELQELYGIEQK